MRRLRDPLLWLVLLFVALLLVMPYSAPLFSALFPELPRRSISRRVSLA